MVLTIALFELRQRLHRVSTYVYFLVFFALSCLFVVMAGGALPNATVRLTGLEPLHWAYYRAVSVSLERGLSVVR